MRNPALQAIYTGTIPLITALRDRYVVARQQFQDRGHPTETYDVMIAECDATLGRMRAELEKMNG